DCHVTGVQTCALPICTLNEVVLRGFRTEFDHVSAVVYQLLFFSDKLGLTASSFNDYFQGALFPGVDYGMASNIWAQMWSAGGWRSEERRVGKGWWRGV